MNDKTAYPLSWPEGWPRVKSRSTSKFKKLWTGGSYDKRNYSLEEARTFLANRAYRILVKKHHPDVGGDPELFRRLTKAMECVQLIQNQSVPAQS
jgi:hypothetical protein